MEYVFEIPVSCLEITGTTYGRQGYYAVSREFLGWLDDNARAGDDYFFRPSSPPREIMVNKFESTYAEMDLIVFKNKDSATLFKLTWS